MVEAEAVTAAAATRPLLLVLQDKAITVGVEIQAKLVSCMAAAVAAPLRLDQVGIPVAQRQTEVLVPRCLAPPMQAVAVVATSQYLQLNRKEVPAEVAAAVTAVQSVVLRERTDSAVAVAVVETMAREALAARVEMALW